MRRRLRGKPHGVRERGQGLVEISLILPVFLLLLLAMLEFGFVFDHNLSLSYASREGARVGAALVNGGGPLGCGGGQSPNAAAVDPAIVTAVDRVLNSPGSLIDRSAVSEIRIYRANSSGNQIGASANTWVFSSGSNTFVPTGTQNWSACSRTFAGTPDSIGVQLIYNYSYRTPLSAIMSFFSGGLPATLAMRDRTVMAMNPLD